MQVIVMHIASDIKDWDMYSPSATYAYNTCFSENTGDTPFFLTYGSEPVKLSGIILYCQ